MPKVTKELMKALIDANVFPPRHQRGCPKNFARMFPLILAAMGKTIEEIKERVAREYQNASCTCKK